ncbi:hypothetical protein ABRY23_12775 [Melioribacteraceae bacterium 4301-Me]|uniref:hypothetical protein n=1 Tax=Pyranulibacter aquaticus TaxID=3163344 RepID=UPI00359C08C2
MKKILIMTLFIAPAIILNAQKIGKLAPEKPPEVFPPNAWGIDLMFGEGGFGLGTFYRKSLSQTVTGFVDISFSESKDEREVEYIDYFGNTYVFGKKNRVFVIPLNFGAQYRLFMESLTDNLRPYVCAGIGPTLVLTTPYDKDYFAAFGDAKSKIAAGGYIGFGANIGTDKSNLVGLNLRYYYIRLFDGGVENLENRFRKELGGVYISLNIGLMY